MGKKLMGAPSGGSREPAQKRRQPKRSRRSGMRSAAPDPQSPAVGRPPAPKTAKPRTKKTPATAPATPAVQASGHRYDTLAHMAALSNPTEHAGSSSPSPSSSSHSPLSPSADAAQTVDSPGVAGADEWPAARTGVTGSRLPDSEGTLVDRPAATTTPEISAAPVMSAGKEVGERSPGPKPAPRQQRRAPRLSTEGADAGSTAATPVAARMPLTETDPLLRQLPLTRPQPLPPTDVVVPVAVVEAGVAAISALVSAVLLLVGSSGAFWTLALTLVAGIGSWLAYGLSRGTARRKKIAGAVLLASQVGIVAWGMVLVGPRVSLLMLVPEMLLLSLRMTGRLVAVTGVVLAVAVYGLLEILWLRQVFRPVLELDGSWLAFLDGTFVVIGLVLLVGTTLDLHTGRSRADHLARSRLQELRQVRAHATQYRLRKEDEATHLQQALMSVLYKRSDWQLLLEQSSSPLQATVELLAERIAILQRDREERLRLEAALLGLIREVERAWLGLPWSWPSPSGTPLDELVVLLRTPSPRDERQEITQETPPLVPIPSLEPAPTSRPWEAPTQHPRVREHLSDPAWSFAQPDYRYHQHEDELDTPAAGDGTILSTSRISPLPWLEWDEWRTWDDRFSS